MRMATGGIKGISAALIAWITYIDKTFTPLFWVLLALVALDMILNVHKEGQQFYKIGSMAISLGVPSYIASNLSNPELGKYLVAIMCLVYLQIVVPHLIEKAGLLKVSKDPKQNAIAQEEFKNLIEKVAAMEKAQAEKVLESATQVQEGPKVIKDGQGGV